MYLVNLANQNWSTATKTTLRSSGLLRLAMEDHRLSVTILNVVIVLLVDGLNLIKNPIAAVNIMTIGCKKDTNTNTEYLR